MDLRGRQGRVTCVGAARTVQDARGPTPVMASLPRKQYTASLRGTRVDPRHTKACVVHDAREQDSIIQTLPLLLGPARTRVDPRHTMAGPHRFLMEWTREVPRGPRATCVGPAGPAQGRMAPRLSWPRRHANNIYCLLNPQRTCAGPAWTHAIQRAVSYTNDAI